MYVKKQKDALRKEYQTAIDQLKKALISKGMLSQEYADQFVFDEKWLNTSTSKKKFKEQVEAQFNSLMEKEKNYKLNLEMVEKQSQMHVILQMLTKNSFQERNINHF